MGTDFQRPSSAVKHEQGRIGVQASHGTQDPMRGQVQNLLSNLCERDLPPELLTPLGLVYWDRSGETQLRRGGIRANRSAGFLTATGYDWVKLARLVDGSFAVLHVIWFRDEPQDGESAVLAAARSIAVYGEIDRYQLWLLSIPWQMSIVVFFITKTRRTSHVETEL